MFQVIYGFIILFINIVSALFKTNIFMMRIYDIYEAKILHIENSVGKFS